MHDVPRQIKPETTLHTIRQAAETLKKEGGRGEQLYQEGVPNHAAQCSRYWPKHTSKKLFNEEWMLYLEHGACRTLPHMHRDAGVEVDREVEEGGDVLQQHLHSAHTCMSCMLGCATSTHPSLMCLLADLRCQTASLRHRNQTSSAMHASMRSREEARSFCK
jgi:hypothetical protein